MITFKQYCNEYNLLEEAAKANTHLTHLEELVLTKGEQGYATARGFITDLLSHLQGKSKRKIGTTVKWDGCVHPDTKVVTKEGSKPISELCDREEVAAFDFEEGVEVYVEAVRPRVNNNDKNWVVIELEDGDTLTCTEDHEVYTSNRGWVEACELTEEDNLLFTGK